MPSKGTPHRPIRISDELWTKAQAKAARLGTTASEKVRELLAEWANEPEDETFADRMARRSLEALKTKRWEDN